MKIAKMRFFTGNIEQSAVQRQKLHYCISTFSDSLVLLGRSVDEHDACTKHCHNTHSSMMSPVRNTGSSKST